MSTLGIERSPAGVRGASEALAESPVVPGYTMLRVVGRGGMGVVWEAVEQRLERHVALKVQSDSADPRRVAQLWAEAKLTARIAHPGVVSVHDVGSTLDGQSYYTMDLVDGTSLRALMRSSGPMQPPRAIAIAIAILDALAAAHAAGIVHCDLKPGNVLIDADGRVKILDFGLAERLGRDRDRAEICGSPPYMSPEQICGEPLTAASDLYSIGVILYEMLAGERPFAGTSMEELLLTVLQDEPPKLSRFCALVHVDLERVCLRCLAKDPSARFSSARALGSALAAVRDGRPVPEDDPGERAYVPRSPSLALTQETPRGPEALARHFRFEFTFDAPKERVWPHVADTDRVGEILGFRPVTYSLERAKEGYPVRHGKARFLGVSIAWQDMPHTWVHHRGFTTMHRYVNGPLESMWFKLTMEAGPGGTTRVTHEVWTVPRGPLGRVAAFLYDKLVLARRFACFYQDLAATLAADGAPVGVFNEPRHRPSHEVRARVQRAVDKLVGVHRFPAELAARLAGLVLYAPSREVQRLRPFALADGWSARRAEVLDLFLHAAGAGMLDVVWELICSECRLPYASAPELQQVRHRGTCVGCGATYDADLSRSVELVFRPHHAIRAVRAERYCVQSPAHRPSVLAQHIAPPGEARALTVELEGGEHRIFAARSGRSWDFTVTAAAVSSSCSLRISDEALEVNPLAVRPGTVTIAIENVSAREEVFLVESGAAVADRVTAAIALNHPTFQAHFAGQAVARGEHLAASRMAFVFVEVRDLSRVFAERGDAGAMAMFCELASAVRERVEAQQGRLVAADLGRGPLVAAFPEAAAALRAALAVAQASAGFHVSAHAGACIAINADDRVDYFGEALVRGAALLDVAAAGLVAVSSAIESDPGAARLIHEAALTRRALSLSGGGYKGERVVVLGPAADRGP